MRTWGKVWLSNITKVSGLRPVAISLACILALAGCSSGGGSSGSATGPAPTISSVTPATGTVGTEISIIGSEFRAGVGVFVGDFEATSVDRVSSTQLFVLVPEGVPIDVALAVRVRNADNTEAQLADAFTAVAPTLEFVNNATKPSGNVGSTVIIEGDAFGDVQGIGQVLFSDGGGGTIAAEIADEADWVNTFIVTTVPSGAEDGPITVVTATGTSNALHFTVTSAATFSPSTMNWTVTDDLPVGLSGHRAASLQIEDAGGDTSRFVHVLGGASDDGVPQSEVYIGRVLATGHVDAWTATSPLPAGRAFHGLVAATPFNSRVADHGQLYVLGGLDMVGGQPTTTVYRAALNEDGSVGEWAETQPLPEPLHALGVVIFRGAIYVAGGATTDNEPVTSVYRARPEPDGELGEWEMLPELPSARAFHGLASFGGFLYAVGGDSAAVDPDDNAHQNNASKLREVAYVRIDLRNGNFAAEEWSLNENQLEKRRAKHSTVVAGGNLFVTSGLYDAAGTGSTESVFAQINADGSVGTFNGATGSNTLLSQGGANLFNQAAISYIDADGVAHVMVIGGDNVNAPGFKRNEVLFY